MDARLWFATETLFAVGAVLMVASHRLRRAAPARRAADWTKFGLYLALIHALLAAAWLGRPYAAALLLAVAAGGAAELHAERTALPRVWRAPATLALAFALAHALRSSGGAWAPAFALLVLLVAATDSFAQLVGGLCGSRRPFPRLSPGKTLEGLAGGIGAALAVALLCGFLAPRLGAGQRLLVGTVTAAAAVGGDLLFSAIKRRARIKDFSTRLPGHGGILDRFDSLVLAAPVYVWTRVLIEGPASG